MVDNNTDDPFAPPEGTIMRPRPGAGRRTVGQTALALAPATPGAPQSGLPGVGIAAPPPAGSGASLADFIAGTDNPILQSAAALLLLAAKLGAVQQASITTLRQQ